MERLFELLEEGYRMEKPSGCSDEIYAVMIDCWRFQPKKRPTFPELVQTLDRLLSQISNTEYVIMTPPKADDQTPPESDDPAPPESDNPSTETHLPET